MADVEITELDELQATKVSGVAHAANGTPFLVLKGVAPDDEDAEKSDSAEADEFEEEVTKDGEVTSKALSAADRKKMPTSSFAFVDKKGGKHLPIHDAPHVKAALGRFGQQDFSEAKGKPTDAKEAAARKIKAAAAKHGIEVSDDADVSTATKGQVQDSLNGTDKPTEAGHLTTGQSSTVGAVVTGTRTPGSEASTTLGGDTTALIPDVTKVDHDSPIPATTDAAGIVGKGVAVASLVQAMAALDTQREAIKDGKFLQVSNTTAPNVPLSELSSTLAGCCRTMEQHLQQERLEAAINPGETSDVWDMEDAKCALESATRLVAFIAAMEAAEGESASKGLEEGDVQALQTARTYLDAVIGDEATKASEAGRNNEEIISMDVTKSELAESIVTSVKEVLKAERKAEKKARKEAEAEAEATKNANNGGDISESEIKPTKETDADNINAVKGGEGEQEDESATKADEAEGELSKAVTTQLETLTKGLADVTELVTKIAKRPRAGGPSLDGQPRPAAEGRLSEVTKSTEDADIETLAKSLETETDPQKKSELGLRLTRARLVKLHETGQL